MENHSGGSEVLPGNQRIVIDMVVHFGKIKNKINDDSFVSKFSHHQE